MTNFQGVKPIILDGNGMSAGTGRDWHREIHGLSPSSGLLPSMATLLPNIHANWFASPTMKAIPSRVRCAYLQGLTMVRTAYPTGIQYFHGNRNSQIYVSVFAAIYQRIGGTRVLNEIDIHALVEAWNMFDKLTAHLGKMRPTDITDAWVIARDLRARSAAMLRCHKCAKPFLVAYDCKLPPNCPVCYEASQAGKANGMTASVPAENPTLD